MNAPDIRMNVLDGMPKGSVCAEIGVYKGEFSESILSIVKPEKLHLIDPWKYEREELYSDSWYGGSKGIDQENMDSIYNAVQEKFSNQIREGVVSIHRLPSLQASALFKDDYFDWVYIDGGHLYEDVKGDLANFCTKVKKGGYLALDDYGVKGWWDDGVLKAVHEFLAKYRCKVAFMAETQIIIQKTG